MLNKAITSDRWGSIPQRLNPNDGYRRIVSRVAPVCFHRDPFGLLSPTTSAQFDLNISQSERRMRISELQTYFRSSSREVQAASGGIAQPFKVHRSAK